MRLGLSAKVRTRDGADVGRVAWVGLQGPRYRVTHLVVSSGARFGRRVRVPLAAIEPTGVRRRAPRRPSVRLAGGGGWRFPPAWSRVAATALWLAVDQRQLTGGAGPAGPAGREMVAGAHCGDRPGQGAPTARRRPGRSEAWRR
jgi:hypothetical protein